MDWNLFSKTGILPFAATLALGVGVLSYTAKEPAKTDCAGYEYLKDAERSDSIAGWYNQRENLAREYLQKYLPEGCRLSFAYRFAMGQILFMDPLEEERGKNGVLCPDVSTFSDSLPPLEKEGLLNIIYGSSPYSYSEFLLYASPRGVYDFYGCEDYSDN